MLAGRCCRARCGLLCFASAVGARTSVLSASEVLSCCSRELSASSVKFWGPSKRIANSTYLKPPIPFTDGALNGRTVETTSSSVSSHEALSSRSDEQSTVAEKPRATAGDVNISDAGVSPETFVFAEEQNVPEWEKDYLKSLWENVPIVVATSSFVKDSATASTSTAISVFWGSGNGLNRSKVLKGETKIESDFDAIFLALRQAIYELNLPRVVVRTDSEYLYQAAHKMPIWRRKEFLTSTLKRMKYADQLEELGRLMEFIEVKMELVNDETVSKAEPAKELEPTEAVENTGRQAAQPSTSKQSTSSEAQVVYVSGAFSDTNFVGQRQRRAGCGVAWQGSPSENISQRVSMFPLTPHRAQLQAIITALDAASEKKRNRVVVKTNFRKFADNYRCFRETRLLPDGKPLTNKPFYERIRDLEQKFESVQFEFADATDDEMSVAIYLAENGMSLPKVLSVAESNPTWASLVQTLEANKSIKGKQRVRIFCRRGDKRLTMCCGIWENGIKSLSPVVFEAKTSEYLSGMCKTIISVLKQAKEAGEENLIIRVRSKRMLKSVVQWLPRWRGSGWLNSVKKPLSNVQLWKELNELLRDIEVKWEFDDRDENVEELKKFDEAADKFLDRLVDSSK